MYSLVIIISTIALIVILGLFVVKSFDKTNSLIVWLQVFFSLSFISCISLMIYYTHYYLGESKYLQNVYFALFYVSIALFFLIIILKIRNYYNSKKTLKK